LTEAQQDTQAVVCLDELPPVLTAEEVALLLRVERKTVYGQFREGKIPGGKRIGRVLRFSRDVILGWLSSDERKKR